jgi:signal transduction histidine kinase
MASSAVDRGPERSGPTGEQSAVRVMSVVAAIGVAGTIVALLTVETGLRSTVALPDLIVWSLLASLAAIATIDLGPQRPVLALDLPVLLACSFALGPVAAGIVAFFGTFDQHEVRGATTPYRMAWNHAQTAASVMIAGAVYHFIVVSDSPFFAKVVAALLALAADALVNYSAVALHSSIASRRSIGHVFSSMRIGSPGAFGAAYTAFGLSSLLLALSFETFGFAGLILFVVPLVLAHEAFSQRHRAEESARALGIQSSALLRVDERIADERSDERARIAAALHDDVLQCLFNVTIRAQVIREDLRSGKLLELEDDVPPLIKAAEQAADELRDVIHGLRKSSIGHAGLVDTLTLLTEHLRDQSGMAFRLDLDSSIKPRPEIELLVYQILREALQNAVKHSSGETVWVTLGQSDGHVVFEVVDNGIGFDVLATRDTHHFGMELMRERADSVGGHLEISSSPSGGTTIRGRLPLR